MLDASAERARGRQQPRSLGTKLRERSADLLSEPDEKSFGASDVAEPIRVLVFDHFAEELRAMLAEPGERIVEVLHGEHDA